MVGSQSRRETLMPSLLPIQYLQGVQDSRVSLMSAGGREGPTPSFPLLSIPTSQYTVSWPLSPCLLPANLTAHRSSRSITDESWLCRTKLTKTSRYANKLPAPPPALYCRIWLNCEHWEERKAITAALLSCRLCAVLSCPLLGWSACQTTLPMHACTLPVPSPPCSHTCLHPHSLAAASSLV